jgi:hypothetical protein
VVPDTGVTRQYWFELSEVTIAPDGVSRYAMAINGSIPGPTIYADWGQFPNPPSSVDAYHAKH